MLPPDVERLLARLNRNPPARDDALATFRSRSPFVLPEEYVRFLRSANGGEGFVGPAYLILWRVEELIESNDAYRVAEYAPGLFLFGTNGGGEAFAFDGRDPGKPIVSVPFIPMELDEARRLASGFDDFVRALAAS